MRLLCLVVLMVLGGGRATAQSMELIGAVEIPRSEQFDFNSVLLDRTYELQVKLPPSYDKPESAERVYPVLYLNDATYNFQVAAGITHLPMNAGTVEEFILVGIGYEKGAGGMDSRTRDYTPSVNPEFARRTGGAGAYLDFVADEVVAMIEARYRADPKARVLGGHSFGGLFGAYALFHRPEIFQGYILSSPSFWFHEGVTFDFERQFAESHDDVAASVYMGIGELEHPHRYKGSPYEMVQEMLDMETALNARGYKSLRVRTGIVPGATHETAFPTVLMNGVLWHFARDRKVPFGY